MLFSVGYTFFVALLGGCLFLYLHIPLPWMLGPLTSMLVWTSLFGGTPRWPVNIRNAGLIILGYLMGRPFTVETARQVGAQFPEMALMTVLTVLFSLLMSYVIYRRTGLGFASCVLGGIPGGLSQMVLLGEEIAAADGTVVTFMQTIRVLTVVFSVPFLALHGVGGGITPGSGPVVPGAVSYSSLPEVWLPLICAAIGGALLAERLKLPTPSLLGPVLATGILVLSGLPAPALPSLLVNGAQLCVGTYMGKNIRLSNLEGQWSTVVPYSLLNAGSVVLFSLGLGWLLTFIIPINLVTGFLSTAPGGIAEMGVTAMQVGADLSTVVAYQTFRMLFVLLVMPLVLKRWLSGITTVESCGKDREGE